ncbi:MAG: LysE family translocator [Chloroflexota bacterium]|nr:LysE family translocator [Chloroflexota bacterium]
MDARLLAYLAVSTLLIVTPGPDTALVVRNALRSGPRAASLTALGVAAGSAVWAFASILGLAVILEASVVVFTLLKLAGAYLCYLGLRSLLGRGAAHVTPAGTSHRAAFAQGALNNLLNPKAAVIFVAVMPQFIESGDPPARFALMLAGYEAIMLAWLNLYAIVVGRVGRTAAAARVRRVFDRAVGVVLIALGLRLVFEER